MKRRVVTKTDNRRNINTNKIIIQLPSGEEYTSGNVMTNSSSLQGEVLRETLNGLRERSNPILANAQVGYQVNDKNQGTPYFQTNLNSQVDFIPKGDNNNPYLSQEENQKFDESMMSEVKQVDMNVYDNFRRNRLKELKKMSKNDIVDLANSLLIPTKKKNKDNLILEIIDKEFSNEN